jgi:hypothetical protein
MNSSPKAELKLDWCSHEAAKYAVEKWHYSHSLPSSKILKIGCWENDVFIGAVIFGIGATKDLVKPYGLTPNEGCELCRVALKKHSTPVSRIVSIAMKMLRKQSPGLRLIVSYADTERDHHGGIYQAMNWLYCGLSNSADEYLVHGKRMHGRSMRSTYGTHLGKDFIIKIEGSRKHRYLYPLDDTMRKQIAPLSKPYPKRADEVTK